MEDMIYELMEMAAMTAIAEGDAIGAALARELADALRKEEPCCKS